MKKLIISIGLLSSSIFLFGQCKTFTKKHCLSSLSPYISNGQINTAKIAPGETIELQLNFNKGLKYRTLVCASEFFEGVTMEIIDQSKKVIFSDTVKIQLPSGTLMRKLAINCQYSLPLQKEILKMNLLYLVVLQCLQDSRNKKGEPLALLS